MRINHKVEEQYLKAQFCFVQFFHRYKNRILECIEEDSVAVTS